MLPCGRRLFVVRENVSQDLFYGTGDGTNEPRVPLRSKCMDPTRPATRYAGPREIKHTERPAKTWKRRAVRSSRATAASGRPYLALGTSTWPVRALTDLLLGESQPSTWETIATSSPLTLETPNVVLDGPKPDRQPYRSEPLDGGPSTREILITSWAMALRGGRNCKFKMDFRLYDGD